MAFDIQGSELENFFMRFEGNSSIRVEPTITASGGFSKTVTANLPIPHGYNIYYLGQAGPVPIWVDVTFSLTAEAEVEVDASANFHTAIERDRKFYVQVQYSSSDPSSNGWSKSPKEDGLTFDPFTYQINGHGKALARLVPKVDIKLESLFGVEASLIAEVGLEGDASFSGNTPLTADFDLWGTLDLEARMSVIGINSGYLPKLADYNFIDYHWQALYALEPAPLQFTDHPENTPAFVGDNAVFSCHATAGSAISYQWYHNNGLMLGKTSRTLQLNNVSTADAGSYKVRASTVDDEIYSGPVTLRVLSASLSGGLIIHLPLDGHANDASGNSKHATLHGSAHYVSGQNGQAVSFDGNDYVLFPALHLETYPEFTISLWVKHEGNINIHTRFLSMRKVGGRSLGIGYYTSPYGFNYHVGSAAVGNIPFDGNEWNNWVLHTLVFDNGEISAYKNGQLLGTAQGAVAEPDIEGGLGIHWWDSSNATRFIGDIDEVRGYNRALSPSEVQALYQQAQ